MDIYEISGFKSGIDDSGVNFLDPADAFGMLENGYVYRQQILSRKGFTQFANRCSDESRVMGIFENVLPDSTRELLVCTKEFLYSYDEGTDTFTQLANNGSAPAGGFGITSDAHYVSGTTYFTKSGSQRFIFCSEGMSDIYYYDGTDVRSFTQDDPDYAAPSAGALTRATHVIWFGERLNFLTPVIAGATNPQAVLYSGIRDSSGNGDKFNVPGSGIISADTYEILKGGLILGDVIVLKFQRSDWTLEKTRDAFNPYFVRKIPSVLGTDAGFSPVNWNYEIKSVGNTGLITTDGRQSKRFDNKIPYFASDNIDQNKLAYVTGGFDRINGQFLFSYVDANTEADTQDKVLSYNYEESTFSINDQRFSVFGQTDAGTNLTWDDIDETIKPSWARWDTTEEIWDEIGTTVNTQKTLAGDDLGFVYQINQGYDDYFVAISNITQASSAVVTVSESAFQVGDRVIFENVEGMTEINNLIGTVTAATTTSITVNIDSSLFTAYSANGTLSKTISFMGKMAPFNPYRNQGRQCYISHIEVLLETQSSAVNMDIFIDEEEQYFKTIELIPTTNSTKFRQWKTAIVNQEANFITLAFHKESAVNQVIISAIRIHCSPGPLTAG